MRLALPHSGAFLALEALKVLNTLKPLGLQPGRALANANPTPEQKRRYRDEQFRYIVMHCAEARDHRPSWPEPLRASG